MPGAGPATGAAPLVGRRAASTSLVGLMMLLVILFVALHGRLDAGDPKLRAVTGRQERVRFR